jgi:hypothetical protein
LEERKRRDEVDGVMMEKFERSGNAQQIIGSTGASHEDGERSGEGNDFNVLLKSRAYIKNVQ